MKPRHPSKRTKRRTQRIREGASQKALNDAKVFPRTTSQSTLVERRIRDFGGWQSETLLELRTLILEAEPRMREECKWFKPSNPKGVPVWSYAGIVCTGEAYKNIVKLTFARGASVPDPAGLFNASLEGNARRAIDIHDGDKVDPRAFKALIRAAVTLNERRDSSGTSSNRRQDARSNRPLLLSGDNPQIAKADGEGPVSAYLEAIPGWKKALAKRIDAIVTKTVPGVQKAMKWNSPFYGLENRGWFLSFHMFKHYVKITFFRGTSLKPPPPGASKHREVRYLDIRENDELDEAQLVSWMKQAAKIPGWSPGKER